MNQSDWTDFERELKQAARELPICRGAALVPGEGDRRARVVLVGEAPGGQEDKAGRPFVGPAGRQLDEILREAGLDREAVWITNVVKCRPTESINGRLRNRAPTREEFEQFLPWLERELELIQPDALVCLGATAAKAILGRRSIKMSDIRGGWMSGVLGIDTLVTYHPSFLLRRTTARDQRLAEVIADMKLVAARVSHG
jgi:uracil-DNA glycosylase